MKSFGLNPINNKIPTHFTKTNSTLLDLIFVSNNANVLLYDQLSAPCFSKHDLIFMTYDFQLQVAEQVISYHDFKNIDYNYLLQEFFQINWQSIFLMESVDEELSFLEHHIRSLFVQTVPLKTIITSQKARPWFSKEIKHSMIKRDIAYSRWKRYKTVQLHNEYRFARNETNKLIRDTKSTYYSNKFTNSIGSKKTWQNIREIGVGKNTNFANHNINPNIINEKFVNLPMIEADLNFYSNRVNNTENLDTRFNFIGVTQIEVWNSCMSIKSNAVGSDELHPKFLKILLPLLLPIITHIFNKIITSSSYPPNWKKAIIIPIPKANADYRPIAILPYLSKALEKLLHQQIITFLNNHKLITDRQSGFRSGHSCLTALIDVSEDIRKEIDHNKITCLVLLDHSKAFDTVDHAILGYKLQHFFSFSTTSTRLLLSYLKLREQYVHTLSSDSSPLPVKRGVPQGSILGPLLFTLYANDIPDQLEFCNVRMYADDVQIYISCKLSTLDECILKLNYDLQRLYLWASANGLSINPDKSKCIIVRKRSSLIATLPPITLNNQPIQTVNSTKNLGIIFNSNLNWKDHIIYACGRTFSMLRTLWKTKYCTPINIRILLAKTYLMPTLLYGSELFANCDAFSRSKLKVVFNAITRYVFNLKGRVHVSSFSKQIYGMTFQNLLKTKVLTMLHKIIYNQQPDHLYNRLSFSRSNRGKRLTTLQHNSLISEWQFFIYAIRLWNSLPHSVQLIGNVITFKKIIVKHFSDV